MRTAGYVKTDRPKCAMCGEEVKPTDREAVFITMCKVHGGLKESKAYICGDCYYNAEICEAWRDGE